MTKLISLSRKSGSKYEESLKVNVELIKACETYEELKELLGTGSKATIKDSASQTIRELQGYCVNWAITLMKKDEEERRGSEDVCERDNGRTGDCLIEGYSRPRSRVQGGVRRV